MRIAIVNDMPLAIEAMRRVIQSSDTHSIAWIARDGAQALEHCARDVPDLILMDLIMPVMDGVEATRQIMATFPCAILIVTASVMGNSAKLFEAMGVGALDAVRTPVLGAKNADGAAALLYKIDSIGWLIGHRAEKKPERPQTNSAPDGLSPKLVLIGASAGGPGAVAEILSALPKDFAAGVVVVQHVDAQFVAGLSQWLNSRSNLPVRIANEGDEIKAGMVLLAGGNDHLIFRDSKSLGYTHEPLDIVYRPSIDVLFQSAARHWNGEAIGIILTGMGRDGALGLKALRSAAKQTIAQDSASCAVYGMPKAAVELGGANEVLPLQEIASSLVRKVGQVIQQEVYSSSSPQSPP